jgi:hypothetical protein
MSPEWLTAIGTLGTFVVIAASAVAALMQLRHMRSGHQIAALTEIRETMESTNFQQALRWTAHELPRLLEEPRIRALIANAGPLSPELEQARTVGNFFETTGAAVRHGFIDRGVACDLWGYVVARNWDLLAPFIANRRAAVGSNLFEHFEYLAVISRHWAAEHRDGTYPKNLERMPLPEPWALARKDESSRVS